MKQSSIHTLTFVHTVILSSLLLFVADSGFAFLPPANPPPPNLDKRQKSAPQPTALSADQAAALDELRAQVPNLKLDFEPVTGSPKSISTPDGFLSGQDGQGKGISAASLAGFAAADPYRVTKAFLQDHSKLFGFGPEALDQARISRDYVTAHNGLRTVVWEQQVAGIAVFEAVLISHTTSKSELVSLCSQFVPEPKAIAADGGPTRAALLATPVVTAPQAVALAAQEVGVELKADGVTAAAELAAGPEQRQKFTALGLKGEADAKLIWLPMDKQTLRLCWDVILMSRARGEMFRTLVDARTGEVLLRRCLTDYLSDASYRVFTSDSPSPLSPGYPTPVTTQPPLIARTLVTLSALDTNASPAGWINDGGNETLGNNVDAHTDWNADNLPDLPRPQGSPFRVFDFPMDLTTQDPTNYSQAAVVQLFYLCNWYHDKLYELGFTEAAGNFQSNNFARGGLGNDAVQADAQDGSGTDNANFSTPPDGSPGRMQMYIFTGMSPRRDGDLDAEIVLHEHTHGLSWRLVGGGQGLGTTQSDGMGEGWSDFYGLALLSEAGDDVNGNYAAGAYASYKIGGASDLQNYYFGIRRYPYTTALARNPLTFKDIDPGQADYCSSGAPYHTAMFGTCSAANASEVHNSGEVWCVTLWEARANLINKYGWAVGNQLILQLVTDGMKLTPMHPNFLQARDAIIQADLVDNGGANRNELWAAFAKRGMGFSATSPTSTTTTGIHEAFDLPDDLRITPNSGFTGSGPVGGPFSPNSISFTLTNAGSASFSWTAVNTATWLNVLPTGGTLTPGGGAATVTANVNASAASLPMGIYSSTVWFTNLNSHMAQGRDFTLRVGQPDYYTEMFDTTTNDLAFQSFTFIPNGSASYYAVCREPAASFRTDPTGGTTVALTDDSFSQVTLTGGSTVAIYGTRNAVFFIGSNGYLTMGSGDTSYTPSYTTHFNRPRVSALFRDLNPSSGGAISWKQLADRAAVTYLAVPQYGSSTLTNSFQIELFFDGRIRLTYLGLKTQDGLAGLSAGTGLPSGFTKSDLTSYGACSPLTVLLPPSAIEGSGVLLNAGSVWLSGVRPTNLVLSLASSLPSRMTVPAATTIAAGQLSNAFNLTIVDNSIHDGDQTVTVTASAPDTSASATMLIIDDDTPSAIVVNPASITVGVGGTATFSVTATGKAPLSYFWRRNGTPIAGANASSYTTNNVQVADSGSQFSCFVSNNFGTALSSSAVLNVTTGGVDLITFDDLPGSALAVPAGYHGLTWGNFSYTDAYDRTNDGYHAGMITISNVAYNAYGTSASISQATPFSLVSAYLTAAWNDNLQVQVLGYAGATLAYNNTYILSATSPTLISFNYSGVTEVDFVSSGGTPHPGYTGSGTHFAMDNMTVSANATNNVPPTITCQPVSQSVAVGGNATFCVCGVNGTPPFSYFWRRNGSPIAGATASCYTSNNVQLADSGSLFSCLVSNAYGTALSASATLTVTTNGSSGGPVLWDLTHGVYGSSQPSGDYSSLVTLLTSRGFTVNTTSTGITNLNLASYRVVVICLGSAWYSAYSSAEVTAIQSFVAGGGGLIIMGDNTNCPNANINPIAAAFGATCGISNLSPDDLYFSNFVAHPVFNGCSQLYYRAAGELSANPPGSIIARTASGQGTVATCVSGGRVLITGDVNCWGQAYIINADNQRFAQNAFDWVAQASSAPSIVTQPSSVTVPVGGTATFSVTASGTAPLSYFWRRNGTPIAGANASSYATNNVQLADSGAQFSCLVSNAYGTAVSSNATLTVTPPPASQLFAILGAPNVTSFDDDVRAKILAANPAAQVNLMPISPGNPTPTLAQLQAYAAVFVYTDTYFTNGVGLGNVLADYVDAGGGVVVATFGFNSSTIGMSGRLVSGGYLPLSLGPQTQGSEFTLAADLPQHPILAGVAVFAGGSSSYHEIVTLQSSAVQVAHWSDGQPLVATKQLPAAGRVAGLNFYPPSESVQSGLWRTNTAGGLLMANALQWASGASTTVVTTTNYWDGSSAISSFGEPDTATYGQTFTVTNPTTLASYTLYLQNTAGTNYFAFYVMAWDGTKATGPILYASPVTSTAGRVGMQPYTFYPGNLPLAAGTYVAFISASAFFDGVSDSASQGAISSNVYSGGGFYYFNNGATFSSLTNSAWNSTYSSTRDTAFVATFGSSPISAPSILTQPQNVTATVGGTATFSVTASGTAPLNYFWRRNGTAIAGANASSYATNNVQLADSGAQFSCLVSNAFGSVLSSNALLAVIAGGGTVSITPASPTTVGNCIPFGANTLYGFTGFIYRNVPAFSVNPGDRLRFDLGAMNDLDIRRNIYIAQANLNPAPGGASQGVRALGWTQIVHDSQIPTNPRGNLIVGDYELTYTIEASFSFSGGGLIIGFGGSPPGSFADNTCDQVLVRTTSDDVSGNFHRRFYNQADQDTAVLDSGSASDFTQNIGGFIIENAGPTNCVAPTTTAQPASITVSAGSSATFCVTATGTAPLNYFWRRNGSPIAGATASCYTTNNVQLADSGNLFSCLVSNACGTVLSSNAVLTISGPGGVLTTTFAGGNGASGNMFDIVPKINNLGITALDVNVGPTGTVATVTVYYRNGTSFGYEGTAVDWILLGTRTVTAAGAGVPTHVDLSGNGVQFLQSQTYGLYVYSDASMTYTDGTNTYENADLRFISNCGKGTPAFTGSTFFPRIWNGAIYYTTGGPTPVISVVPASQDFGTVLVGAYADRTFFVTNSGGGTLVGSATSSANPPFSILSGGSYSLGSGQGQAVVVRYSPTVPGTQTANVMFTGGGGATRPVFGQASAANALRFAVGTNSGPQFSQVVVPVQVTRFTNISSFQFSYHWNTSVATFVGVEQFGVAGLAAGNFGTSLTNSGTITVSWDDPDGLSKTLADGTTVFAVRFQMVGSAGATTALTIDGTPTSIEAVDGNLNLVSVETVPGRLSISAAVTISGAVTHYGPTNAPPPVPGVTMTVTGNTNLSVQTLTNGSYSVVVNGGGTYIITPGKADDTPPAKGVTTLDISLIRRHILGIAALDSPYKLLAADVNCSKSVTTLDITLIRRLILGITNSFPCGLWRFVPASYVFPDPQNPWDAPVSLSYTNPAADQLNQNYVAVKLGDVNSSWTVAGLLAPLAAARSAAEVGLQVSSHFAQPGETVSARVCGSGLSRLTSAQFTLEWDPTVLRYAGTGNYGLEGLSAGNFGTAFAESGKLALSWDDPGANGMTLPDGAVLFTVNMTVIGKAGSVSGLVLADSTTPRELGLGFSAAMLRTESGQVNVVGSEPPQLSVVAYGKGTFSVSLPTLSGKRYILEFTESLSGGQWTPLPVVSGDGTTRTLTDPSATSQRRFYRVRVE